MLLSYRHRRLLGHPVLRVLLVLLLLWDTLYILDIYKRQSELILHPPTPPPNDKRIYIATQHWNTAAILRSRWSNALLGLVQELGTKNVFVSIYESGSYDKTKDALRELDAALGKLNIDRKVVLSDVSHKDEIEKEPADHGWVKTPGGKMELRRIPFLADLRNRVLEPLEALSAQGHTFDMVLFLNDVVFTAADVLRLLDTNRGEYAAACSLDFSKPPLYYDTFALRDSQGMETVMQTWPYFRSSASRHAMVNMYPVPVASCWNGMVAMPAEPFLAKNPLRFRGAPDSLAASHVEASECCLIHADNPLSATKGVFLNPTVRVGYNATAYDTVNSKKALMSPWHIYWSVWKNRILRWTTTAKFKEWVVRDRVRTWMRRSSAKEPGEFCLVNEMQIIKINGWKHV